MSVASKGKPFHPDLVAFYHTFLEPTYKTCEFVRPVSCSSFDATRSAHHQHSMLHLTKEHFESKDDHEVMEEVLPFCSPCFSGSCRVMGPPFIPKEADSFTYVVNRAAFSSWCPQNHMDCAAAAMAGAINTAMGWDRKSLNFLSSTDIVNVMKRRCEAVVTKEVEEINKRKPHIDLSPFYSAV